METFIFTFTERNYRGLISQDREAYEAILKNKINEKMKDSPTANNIINFEHIQIIGEGRIEFGLHSRMTDLDLMFIESQLQLIFGWD